MTEVTPHPLKTQGFHHFFILLFYDHPANDVTININCSSIQFPLSVPGEAPGPELEYL